MDLWAIAEPSVAARIGGAIDDVLIALISGSVASLVTLRVEGRRHRGDVVRTDVDRGLEALAAVRSAYRRRALTGAVDDADLAQLEDALDLAAQRTTPAVVAAARRYVRVGQLYAARDPDTGDAAEGAAYEELTAALMAERKAYV